MGFDFAAAVNAPFRMQPGLRRLAAGTSQLTPAPRRGRHLHEKLAVLGAHPQQVLLSAPGFDAQPALATLAAQAALEHPDTWRWDGETAQAVELGWSVRGGELSETPGAHAALPEAGDCLRALPSGWRLAGLLSLAFAEDFAILDGEGATIPWLAVALPSHWAPSDKVGRHFTEVHAPVADNRQLLAAGASLARLVSDEARWERFVWSITAHPKLNAHPVLCAARPWLPSDAAAQACWRTEHQTFLPVAGRRQAVFTIHVEVQPLAEAIDSTDKAARLHAALASMSPQVQRYRGLHAVRDELLSWLAQRATR
jgi:hypothetical protein